jgi:tRNA modification GTPase
MGNLRDTICALSTAPGRSGIAVVRLSGPESCPLLSRVFLADTPGEELPPRQAVLGSIVDPQSGETLDQAIVTRFPAPNSYTGEDLVEISLHGSPVLIAALIERLCALGARLAAPGEFTMRAFLRGRMDLTQAEAIHDLISATTLYQAQVAARQRSGEISLQLRPIRQALIDVIVQLESAVEFVEDDLALESRELLAARLEAAGSELRVWIDSFRRGRIVRDGFSMAIVGKPNVGKSSLFNALLRQERSIVTETPGTTRDLVSEYTSLDGIPVRLLDTAGVRASEDQVERMGVDRSLRAMADADAILLVVDRSRLPSAEDEDVRRRLLELSCIVVMNKSDLECRWSDAQKAAFAGDWPRMEVSAKTGERLEALRKEILSHLFGDSAAQRDGILITNLRHCQCLESAQEHLTRAGCALRDGLSEEFVLVDLHAALREFGAITGETSVEDLLNEIFSRFCIGK